jgi:hypothetical protein
MENRNRFNEAVNEILSEGKKFWKYFKKGDKEIEWEDHYDGEVRYVDKKTDEINVYFPDIDEDEDIDAEALYKAQGKSQDLSGKALEKFLNSFS